MMIRRNTSRRTGVTLTETLVAIFVCGLGLMALMTLFPIGALNMQQALKDDRTAHAAANAASILRSIWRVSLENGQTDRPLEQALQNGPVYLDPVGFYGYPSGTQVGNPPCGIPRVTLQVFEPPLSPGYDRNAAIIRWFSLLDDVTFAKNGTPKDSPQVHRDAKYSWAYMMRRLKGYDGEQKQPGGDPRAIEFSVVVYASRSVGTLALNNSNMLPQGELTLSGSGAAGSKTITLSYSGAKPNLRKGGWIMQAPDGYFYRVVQVTDNGGSLAIEVQTPLRIAGNSFVIMDNVVEVFERSTLE